MGHRLYDAALLREVGPAQVAELRAPAHDGSDEGPAYMGEFGEAEAGFIAARDSFYLATVGVGGWPHVEHRGGPVGFVEVQDPQTLVFPDYRASRRPISIGDLAENARVCLVMTDYERQVRLKILGSASLVEDPPQPANGQAPYSLRGAERHWMIKLEGLDWNVRQYIPRRFPEDRVQGVIGSLQAQIRALKHRISTLELSQ
jgi:hypothetical protein